MMTIHIILTIFNVTIFAIFANITSKPKKNQKGLIKEQYGLINTQEALINSQKLLIATQCKRLKQCEKMVEGQYKEVLRCRNFLFAFINSTKEEIKSKDRTIQILKKHKIESTK